jgi:alpha-galactosidase
MASVELAIIGGGSAQFSLGVIKDLANLRSLHGSRVRLMDINQRRLDVMQAVGTRLSEEMGAGLTFTRTLDREEALEGADFVLNCALVGGWRGRGYMREITEQFGEAGLRLTPTVLYTFRQLDLFASVARDIQRVCPDAWYIQSANPMTSGITLVNRVAPIRAVGLCHGIHGVDEVCRTIGLDPARIDMQAYGLNHFIWMSKFHCDGVDMYPYLDEWIEKEAPAFWQSDRCWPSHTVSRKAVRMYKLLGLYPIGDTCTPGGGNWPDWFRKTPELAAEWNEDTGAWIERHIQNMEDRIGQFEKALADGGRPLTDSLGSKPTAETNVTIIDALANDRSGIFQVNVVNDGAIPGIRDDMVVELPAYVCAAGIQKLKMQPLPEPIMYLIRQRVHRTMSDVETYLSRSRERLLLAILGESDVGYDVASTYLDAVLNHPLNKDMAAHFV